MSRQRIRPGSPSTPGHLLALCALKFGSCAHMVIHLGSGGSLPLTRSGVRASHLRRHPGHHPQVRHAVTRNRNTGRRAGPSDRKSTTGQLCMPQRWLLPPNFAALRTIQFRLRIYETSHTTGCGLDADAAWSEIITNRFLKLRARGIL